MLTTHLCVNVGASSHRAILINETPKAVLLGNLVKLFLGTGGVKLFRLGLHDRQLLCGGYKTTLLRCFSRKR